MKRSPGRGRRPELVLLGCGALLAAVGLGFNLLALAPPEETAKPARWDGFFHRAGGHRQSSSRRESPLKTPAAVVSGGGGVRGTGVAGVVVTLTTPTGAV